MTAPLISPESSARWYAERGRVAGEDDTTVEQGEAEWAAYLAAQAEVAR